LEIIVVVVVVVAASLLDSWCIHIIKIITATPVDSMRVQIVNSHANT